MRHASRNMKSLETDTLTNRPSIRATWHEAIDFLQCCSFLDAATRSIYRPTPASAVSAALKYLKTLSYLSTPASAVLEDALFTFPDLHLLSQLHRPTLPAMLFLRHFRAVLKSGSCAFVCCFMGQSEGHCFNHKPAEDSNSQPRGTTPVSHSSTYL